MKMRTVLRILLLAIVLLAVAVPASADVWLPGSLTEIESQAFMNSAWLSGSCTIPEGTKTIGAQAFYGCSGITTLKVASTVKVIGSGAFAGCTGLTGTVTIPEGCEVADDAFANCPNVTVVYEGANPSELFSWKISGGEATITAYKGGKDVTSIIVPASVDGYPVTAIDAYVFSSNRYLTHISLPSTIESIGNYAFSYCSKLTSVSMPTSVKTLGRYAFYYSSAISGTFELIDAEIPSNAFTGCKSLSVFAYASNDDGSLTLSKYYGSQKNVTVPRRVGKQSVTALGREAFSYCTALEGVVLPSELTTIGPSAFYYCTGLKDITIPYGVTTIGANAFYNCESLKDLALPKSLLSIGNMAFCECDGLTGTYSFIGTNVASSAFSGVSGVDVWCYARISDLEVMLESCISSATVLNIPSTVEDHFVVTMRASALASCPNVTTVTIPETFDAIPAEAFYRCTTLKTINIPDTVKSIGLSAFYGCSSLTSVTIPATVTTVGPQSFYLCTSLTSLTVESASTQLGPYAFADCSKLSSISMPGDFSNVADMTLTGTAWMDAKLASIAKSLTGSCSTDYERALVLHDWLVSVTAYDQTYTYYGPEGVLFHGTGVCNAYTLTYSKMLSSVGIANKTVVGSATDKGTGTTGSHAWVLVKLGGDWYHVDPTWDDPIPDGRERHTYFCLTDSQMAVDHQWNTASYPAANGTTYSGSAASVSVMSLEDDELSDLSLTETENEEAEENEWEDEEPDENHRKDKKDKKEKKEKKDKQNKND